MTKAQTGAKAELRSAEPMKVARWLVGSAYEGPWGRSSLISVGHAPWVFDPVRGWTPTTDRKLDQDLMKRLEDLQIVVKVDRETGEKKYRSFAAREGTYRGKIQDVRECLKSLVEMPTTNMPFWREAKWGDPDPDRCIVFQNTVLSVGEGGIEGLERDDRFVTPCTLPFDYEPDAECPRWMQCLKEWSGNEPGWAELLQRWWGYILMSDRSLSRWMYMHGKVRGGKGLNLRLASRVLSGHPNYVEMNLEELTEQFGLDGLRDARVMGVPEINAMGRERGEVAGREIKRFLGGDMSRVNTKYGGIEHGVRINPAPWICGNEMLLVSNSGEGLSSKMLPLSFRVSFLNRENVRLEEELWEEMPGILAWAVEGAIKLWAAEPQDRWPMPESSEALRRRFRLFNNPLEQFMETMFVRSDSGSVVRERVLRLWEEFRKENRISTHIPTNQLLSRIEQDTSWSVWKGDRDGAPILRGVSIRKRGARVTDI